MPNGSRTLVRWVAACALLCGLDARVGSGARAQRAAPARHQLDHTAWTIRDGAPADVMQMVQSADGFLWLAGSTGLFRFDGVRFERYEPPAGPSMPSRNVSALQLLADGSLWIGYRFGGASVLERGQLTHYGQREGLPSATVRAFARDAEGTVWAATRAGLFRLTTGRWRRVDASYAIPDTSSTALLTDHHGTLWAATLDGVYARRRGELAFTPWVGSLRSGRRRALRNVQQLVLAPDGSVWSSSFSEGLVQLAGAEGGPPPVRIVAPLEGRERANTLLVDADSNLWVATSDRVYRTPLRTARGAGDSDAAAMTALAQELRDSGANALLQDREGNVWVGSDVGLDRFRRTKLTRVVLPQRVVWPALAAGDDGAMWVASDLRPPFLLGRRITSHPDAPAAVECAYRDLGGGLWLGSTTSGLWHSSGGAWSRVVLPRETDGRPIQSVALDRAGRLWVSAMQKGVYRRDGGSWTDFGEPLGLAKTPAITVVADSAGRVWLGYTDGRLALVRGDSLRLFSAADGLRVGNVLAVHVLGDHVWVGGELGLAYFDGERFRPVLTTGSEQPRGVSGIVETPDGEVWLNGGDGVARVPAAELRRVRADPTYRVHVEHFDYHDGLDAAAPQLRPLPSAIRGTDGRIWFVTTMGVLWVDPAHVRRNPLPPPVQVRAVEAGARSYPTTGVVRLPERTTALHLRYTALSLAVPDRVHFRYRLVGADSAWQDAGTRREAFYTNLPPGSYRFHVMASNEDGVWNEAGAALDLVIPPTFVQTNAFLALCALAAAGAAWLLSQWRQRQGARALHARFEVTLAERTRIAQELHDTLLGGFLGVTAQLYAVKGLLTSRPADAAAMLSQALATADASLRDARHAVWEMRAPELDAGDLPDALAAAARDALAATSVTFQLMVRGERRPLPPAVEFTAFRIGREAVTNAAKHANAHVIALDLSYGRRTLALTVRDDGCGFLPAEMDGARHDGHFGVVGMRERARSAGGTLDIAAAADGGTQVTVSLPLHDG